MGRVGAGGARRAVSLELRAATVQDFPAIHSALLSELDADIPAARWRRLFEPGWSTDQEAPGFALWEGNYPVGFLATLHRPRPNDGKSRICNLSSWIVLEEHRGSALRLLGPLLARTDLTLVNLSPIPEVYPIFKGLGFRPLETEKFIAPVRPDLPLRIGRGGARVRWHDEPSEAGDAGPLRDHAGLVRRVDLVAEPGDAQGCASVLYSVRVQKGVRSIRLHHVPDPEIFRGALPSLWRGWLIRHRAPVVEYDARILRGTRLPAARRRVLDPPRLVRSPDRTPEDLADELYSEVVLLEL